MTPAAGFITVNKFSPNVLSHTKLMQPTPLVALFLSLVVGLSWVLLVISLSELVDHTLFIYSFICI